MVTFNILFDMIKKVAEALGDELLDKVVFVGGCTTALLITDETTKESVRATDDVDLIVHVMGYPDWHKLQSNLRKKGFSESPQDDVICTMHLGDLRIDLMPDEESVLGFTNKWYAKGFETATYYQLTDKLKIKLLTPPYFIATKLEAYRSRGNNDILGSIDLEDILNLFDGREEITQEILNTDKEVQRYITTQMGALLESRDFPYAIQSITRGSTERGKLIFNRIETIIKYLGTEK